MILFEKIAALPGAGYVAKAVKSVGAPSSKMKGWLSAAKKQKASGMPKVAADADQTYKKFQAGITRDSERDSIQGKSISKEVNARSEGPGICGKSVMDMILKKQVNA